MLSVKSHTILWVVRVGGYVGGVFKAYLEVLKDSCLGGWFFFGVEQEIAKSYSEQFFSSDVFCGWEILS